MGWAGSIVVFVVIWWIVFFMVLPWGVQRTANPEPGHEAGAPEKPLIFTKMAVTTLITAVLFALVWSSQEFGWISFREDFTN